MLDVKERSVFVHVDLPGQEDYALDLPEEYVSPFLVFTQTLGALFLSKTVYSTL